MKRALSEYIILGVKTTIPFHKAMMANEHFQKAELHTHFVDEHKQEIIENVRKVVQADKEMENRLKSTFLPPKKVAAVSATISSYMANSINNAKKK